jgi:hypothetical protein
VGFEAAEAGHGNSVTLRQVGDLPHGGRNRRSQLV